MDGFCNSVLKNRYIIELALSFQLLKISIRSCKSVLWTVEKRYNEERAYFKDLQDMLHQHNRYISELRCTYDVARNSYDSYVIIISENARPCGEQKEDTIHLGSNDIVVLMPNNPV
ncbi:hypothetical protein ElyMa_007017400 [Elysia marginata]|uniref:Uncharacterized protein n=1 Tax=Elysia marginata TaxID=1093978 RepID=A0AAV4JQJ1_9GAST|nr:hypothetical protein ElyMa_007017400 [Elysia marginata]